MTKKRVAKKAISADDFLQLMDEQEVELRAEAKTPKAPRKPKTKKSKTEHLTDVKSTESATGPADETAFSTREDQKDLPPLRYQSVLVEWLYSQAFERIDKMGPVKKEILTLTTNLIFRK